MDTLTANAIDFTAPAKPAQDLAVAQPQLPEAMAPETVSVLSIIAQAARDPSVNIDKMERLILMQERIQNRQAQVEYDNAMSAAQKEMQPIRANMENPQTKSLYADYAALDNAIRPIYSKHGFSLSFDSGDGAPAGEVRVVCCVACAGHREYPHLDMPADGKGARGGDVMTKTHATGAAVTYGKRYLLGMIFNLAVTRDDDGNGAGGFSEDDDVRRLATGGVDPATGKLRSTYSATKANEAKEVADAAIEFLNLAPNPEVAKDWRRDNRAVVPGHRKSRLQWLEDTSPGQYHRVKTCFENVTGEEF